MDANPTAESAARLVVERGPEPEKIITLGQISQTIGRSANNGIVINDPEISRRQAQIMPDGDDYLLEDLASTNGTFVNGIRLNGAKTLNHGDTIEFGDTIRLRYWAADMPSEIIYSPADDVVTPALPPESIPAYAQDNLLPPESNDPSGDDGFFDESETAALFSRNRILIGCGCLLLLMCVFCVGGVLFLDNYNQGQLLYCGGLRPFWETVLGPLGFSPICP